MDAPPSADEERRCPNCGALVVSDSPWCGQCFASLIEPEPDPDPRPEPEPEVRPEAVPARTAELAEAPPSGSAGQRAAPTWPCPSCGNANAIDLDVCALCGTPFADLMRQDERPAEVDPKDALVASLIFPGLGHRKIGRGVDGLARGVLFAMLVAMALLTGSSEGASGLVAGLFVFCTAFAAVVYLGSAWEAYRMAEGGPPFVSARVLLWATVGVILLSVVALAFTVATTAKR